MKKHVSYIVLAILMTACSEDTTLDLLGMFSTNGEPVNKRFEQSMAYNKTIGDMHLDMGSDEYTVFVCADSHITRKTHVNLDTFVNRYNAVSTPKMALHLGDLINAQNNFACADSILGLANGPLYVTPGNHDLYFKQWSVYQSYFKTGTYWFDTRNGSKKLDLYICLDSGEGTLGTKQTDWLRNILEQKSQEGYRRIIVFTHTHFWKLDESQEVCSNFSLEETYELASLFSQYGVSYVWCGHQHARQSVVYKGVNFLVLDATKDGAKGAAYMTVQMGDHAIFHYIDY